MNFARTNLIDRLNRKSPIAAQVGLGDLLDEIIDAINDHANRVFTVFPDWKTWQGTYNAVATNVASMTTTHLDVLNSMVETINTVTAFLSSTDFQGSAQFKVVATSLTVADSDAAPLATVANSAAAITITTDIYGDTGDTITSYNAAITAINSAMWEQTTVLDNLIGKINKIGLYFSCASDVSTGSAKMSTTWNLIAKNASNAIVHSQGTYPLVTTMCSKTVAKATVMTDLVEAQEIYNRAMRRLYQASNGNTGFFSNIHKAWSVTTAIQHFLTDDADYTGKQAEALIAMEDPGSVTISLDDAMDIADLYSVASVTTALADILPVTQIISLETRGETGGFS
jgi:hypothetical protein